jgi:hypothetical protein
MLGHTGWMSARRQGSKVVKMRHVEVRTRLIFVSSNLFAVAGIWQASSVSLSKLPDLAYLLGIGSFVLVVLGIMQSRQINLRTCLMGIGSFALAILGGFMQGRPIDLWQYKWERYTLMLALLALLYTLLVDFVLGPPRFL